MITMPVEVVIGEAVARLAVARGGQVDDIQSDVYVRALAGTDAEWIALACQELGREPRASFESVLPPVATILGRVKRLKAAAAIQARQKQLGAMPASEADPRTHVYCRACQDSAWEPFWCPGEPSHLAREYPAYEAASGVTHRDCGRSKSHGPHPYVAGCTCVPTNPVIHARRERDRSRLSRPSGDRE